jgi:hypothetical protein
VGMVDLRSHWDMLCARLQRGPTRAAGLCASGAQPQARAPKQLLYSHPGSHALVESNSRAVEVRAWPRVARFLKRAQSSLVESRTSRTARASGLLRRVNATHSVRSAKDNPFGLW